MDVKAAVAFEAAKPLQIETVQLEGPKAGEVMVKQLRRRSARRVDLASFNAEHDDRTFGVDDIDWIARVIWSTQ